MPSISESFKTALSNVVVFVVMIMLAVIAFFATVFVVGTGGEMAGYSPDGNFVVLSAALIVVSSVLGAALS